MPGKWKRRANSRLHPLLLAQFACAVLMLCHTQIIYVLLERDCTPFARGAHNDHVIWLYMGEQLFYR